MSELDRYDSGLELYADECRIEELTEGEPDYSADEKRFKYTFCYSGETVYESEFYYESYEEAEEDSDAYLIDEESVDPYNYYVRNGAKYIIDVDPELGIDYDIEKIEIEDIEIIETEE